MSFFRGNGFCFETGSRTYIMGILNVTPDSFYDGGRYNSPELAVKHAAELEADGADIIDIGANSTRPGAVLLTAGEELEILKSCLPDVVKAVDVPVSVDTFYPEAADFALEAGARIINDVSGRITSLMTDTVKRHNAGYIVTHNPLFSSSEAADYSADGGVVNSVRAFFDSVGEELAASGILAEQLIFDIGIGFSKTQSDDVELIRNLGRLKRGTGNLLAALSNKRMTAVFPEMTKAERLYSTIAADTLAIAGRADFIRVHNVREAKLSAEMADRIVR